jgi:FkbM family methyltransferase
MTSIKRAIKQWLRRAGFDLVRYDPASQPLPRRARLLTAYRIGLVFDVGANTGQYAKELRNMGYAGRIVSFEPLRSAYDELAQCATADGAWEAVNAAVGDTDGHVDIHVAGNSQSSSILEMLPRHVQSAPQSKYYATERVRIVRLDSIFHKYYKDDHVYLKIDTQGFERWVLDGAVASLEKIDTVQLEMSLVPLYKDETLFLDMYRLLAGQGYVLVSLEQGFTDLATGQTLQVDGTFHRFGHPA